MLRPTFASLLYFSCHEIIAQKFWLFGIDMMPWWHYYWYWIWCTYILLIYKKPHKLGHADKRHSFEYIAQIFNDFGRPDVFIIIALMHFVPNSNEWVILSWIVLGFEDYITISGLVAACLGRYALPSPPLLERFPAACLSQNMSRLFYSPPLVGVTTAAAKPLFWVNLARTIDSFYVYVFAAEFYTWDGRARLGRTGQSGQLENFGLYFTFGVELLAPADDTAQRLIWSVEDIGQNGDFLFEDARLAMSFITRR